MAVDPTVADVVDGEAGDVGRLSCGRDPGKVAGLCTAEVRLDAHRRAIAEHPRRGPLEVGNRAEDGDGELSHGVVAFEARLERHVLEDAVLREAGHDAVDVAVRPGLDVLLDHLPVIRHDDVLSLSLVSGAVSLAAHPAPLCHFGDARSVNLRTPPAVPFLTSSR